MVRVCRVVPKEWEKYTPLGAQIPRTRFIVFKTPLNDRLLTRVPKEQRFNVNNLMKMLAERNQKLGMVIDLTDTDRYYDRNDIEGMCIEYEKINCPGRGFIDNSDNVEAFNQAVKQYTNECGDTEALIGVHCTHGVNRSGYLICRFLIEVLGWTSHEALEAFEVARGHPIANGSYVQALHKASMKRRDRMNDSASDSGSRTKKSKKNKKKRERDDNDGAKQMGDLMQQFLGQIEQQAQELECGSGYGSPSANGNGSYVDSPVQQHWAYPVKKQKLNVEQPAEEEEEEEQYDDNDMGEEQDYEEDGDQTVTKAQKRRQRRARMQNMLHVMRRGNFHEIQEMQEEYIQSKGAAQ